MKYADFMAFLFPQHELMGAKADLRVSEGLRLDYCHLTGVPPYVRNILEINLQLAWFQRLIMDQNQSNMPVCFFGLQNPPECVHFWDLAFLSEMGIKFMTIAYEGPNEYGGGFASPNEHLTKMGKILIDDLARTNISLDLSHAGHQTARDVIEYISKQKVKTQVVATHTACHSIYNHGRNLPDDVLKGISDLGGLVGLVTMTWMLHPTDNTLKPFLDHLCHLKEIVGVDNICLGTDGVYKQLEPNEEAERFKIMNEKIDPKGNFKARYPLEPLSLNRPDKLKILERAIISLGWTKEDIRKVLGGNLIKLFSEI